MGACDCICISTAIIVIAYGKKSNVEQFVASLVQHTTAGDKFLIDIA